MTVLWLGNVIRGGNPGFRHTWDGAVSGCTAAAHLIPAICSGGCGAAGAGATVAASASVSASASAAPHLMPAVFSGGGGGGGGTAASVHAVPSTGAAACTWRASKACRSRKRTSLTESSP
jgi:hypothetical protein